MAMLLDALLALTSDFSWAMRNGGIGCVVLAIGYLIFRSGWKPEHTEKFSFTSEPQCPQSCMNISPG
ncbi:hypothetical protein LO749_08720 [Paracoccus denitrificans]|uniref:hypothetical protein n=1 Tax=Paracoccus denitrificans TaxID=266 RepID=UPI001E43B93C|nr:hypothetical protein [Paracoccus denitrificans]UFS64250.1 hypothetical protein LO749_08720 [Paracoccus denitrificans]